MESRGMQPPDHRITTAALIAIVLLGGTLRFVGVSQRPFWRDEAWVAQRASAASWSEIGSVHDVPAPPLFMAAVKACGWLGAAEFSARLPVLLVGSALPVLAYAASRAGRAPRSVALAAAALCATSVSLVTRSRELKQYGIEAGFSVAFAWLVLSYRRASEGVAPRRSFPTQRGARRFARLLWAASLLAPWLGYASVLPGAVLLLDELVRGLRRRSARRRGVALVGLALLGGSTLGVLAAGAAEQAANPALRRYTARWFIDPTAPRDLARAAGYTSISIATTFFPHDWRPFLLWQGLAAAPIAALAGLGLWSWPRKTRATISVWLIGPWALLLIASCTGGYPFALRQMVFLAPALCVTVAAGLVAIMRGAALLLAKRTPVGVWSGVAFALLPVCWVIQVPLSDRYWMHHDFRAIMVELDALRGVDEPVIVDYYGGAAVRFYQGARSGLCFPPTEAGTLPPPGFDYGRWVVERLGGVRTRGWLLTTNETAYVDWESLARSVGLELDLAAVAGADTPLGRAELWSFSRAVR